MTFEGFSTPEPPQAWRRDAICASTDPELFFGTAAHPTGQRAKRACLRCPALDPCADYALADPSITDGVWGALTAADRREIRRRLKEIEEDSDDSNGT